MVTLLKARRRTKAVTEKHPIETANEKSDGEFIDEYLRPSPGWQQWQHPKTHARYTLCLASAARLGQGDLEACFGLVDETSGADYRGSSFGWHPAGKMKEMRSPELRYVVVREEGGRLAGFMSMMPTFEDGLAVVYCYEIHLKADLQGTGLGKQLMGYLLAAAEAIPSVQKVMLTCFLSNKRGIEFYQRMGFQEDDFSPKPRRLRGGRTVEPDYVILSRGTEAAGTPGKKRALG